METGISCRILAPEFKPKQIKMNTERKYIVFVAGVQVDDELTFNQAFELAYDAYEIGFINCIQVDNGYISELFENLLPLYKNYISK